MFIKELEWRGLLQNTTPGIENLKEITAYIGYDPTAPSLTIGNLVTIMLLKHLQLHGHQPIILLGGATGRIGDPSGKSSERSLLDIEVLERNIECFKSQFAKFLDFDGPNAAVMINNYDFYKDMNMFDFLVNIGKNITVNYMMAKDSVKNRLSSESGISFTEFSYQLIQGYDFKHLYDTKNCLLQMGGSDQWGNITTGMEFIRKSGGKSYGLTCPLLTDSNGNKFGKSEGNNIWLDKNMTSPYKFYQFWLNVSDFDLPKLFRFFSLLSKDKIEDLENTKSPMELKKMLAEELTIRVHSKEDLDNVKIVTDICFGKISKDVLSKVDKELLFGELETFKTYTLNRSVVDFLNNTIFNSKSEVRRAISSGSVQMNGEKVGDDIIITKDHFVNGFILFQNGRKNKFIVRYE